MDSENLSKGLSEILLAANHALFLQNLSKGLSEILLGANQALFLQPANYFWSCGAPTVRTFSPSSLALSQGKGS
ncbi:hypothetical protein DEO72_LG3g1097 [Vigna unguiculata]|uniref:Uncharacterized protein n=1 Tax=Vigna unguiculata TaxID=3917 RepID=A0A4D6LDK0_VIGUN|nr:hypothetical protein DEO72_LG3g1097 [Vigna unguiculata]